MYELARIQTRILEGTSTAAAVAVAEEQGMKDTGGPAFPVPAELCQDLTVQEQRGMTLRDWFAAKAMQTLLGSEYTSEHGLHEGWMGALAHESYMVADAMLAERSKT